MAVSVHDLSNRDPEDRPWLRRILITLLVVVLVGGAAYAAREMGLYGTRRGQQKLMVSTARVEIDFVSRPAWLSPAIIDSMDNKDSLMSDIVSFTQETAPSTAPGEEPITNYRRMQNPQELGVLRDLAGYLQKDTFEHSRAWIKTIRSIKRISVPKSAGNPEGAERILIDAEFREPVAFIVQGNSYYLVEKITEFDGQKQAVRLPGVYSAADRRALNELPCVGDIDSPTPEPGQAFTTPDAIAGLELAAVLKQQPYIKQIASINMSNFEGRHDKDPKPFITLETIYADPANGAEPTHIFWGRSLGEEKYFEVHSNAKLRYLATLFARYNRIDARESYVDLRFDQPVIPMATRPAPQSDASPIVAPATIASAGH